MRWLWYTFLAIFSLGMLGLVAAVGGVVYIISYYGKDLPDYSALKDYNPPVVTRVYAGDGRLMAEFAEEKRVFVPIDVMPATVKQAFVAAEDQNFYTHQGVDYFAILRAVASNVKNMGSGKRPIGASTITQQVAKNFLLTNEVSYRRKIREAILAFRMERALSKDKLLELYLNEIYLGDGAYGVGAASLNYFNKSLEELQVHEASFLAALPKAPNNYNPHRHYEAAVTRRDWVIDRMRQDGYITREQADAEKAYPLTVVDRKNRSLVSAPYFAEEVRRELIEKYGEKSLYKGGLVVRSSIDPRLQAIAETSLRAGLVAYDRRHGWRGPAGHFDTLDGWRDKLAGFAAPADIPPDWKLAVVLETAASEATIGFADGSKDKLLLPYLKWARSKGRDVNTVTDAVKEGDVVMVEQVTEDGQLVYGLRQIPKVNGALVALDPHTGRVLAVQGGWSYQESEFNRATQAWRQPGSAFKPFIYLAALEKGFTPATLVLDAPMEFSQGPGLPKWRPANYTHDYYGPTPLRVGIEKSRNLMTVKLAEYVTMPTVIDYAKKFGVIKNMKPHLANSLGSGETTLLRLTNGYAQFVNGGKKLEPSFIDRIQDRRGKTIYNHDSRLCDQCGPLMEWKGQPAPVLPDTREQVADPRHAYQMVSILEGVVQRGTATRLKSLNRPLAGKTGTTNESRDTWFVGFSPDLVVGVFVGFDDPKPMGDKETGSSVAVPIFASFMEEALKDTTPTPFRVPPGIRQVQVNAATGMRAQPGDSNVIWEAFVTGTEPTDQVYILEGSGSAGTDGVYSGDGVYNGGLNEVPYVPPGTPGESAITGTGGIY